MKIGILFCGALALAGCSAEYSANQAIYSYVKAQMDLCLRSENNVLRADVVDKETMAVTCRRRQ